MPDLTKQLLPRLLAHRLEGLNLGDGFVYPAYASQSILNLPPTICRLLGVPEFGAGALSDEILAPLGTEVRHVVLILMDAMALHRLQRWMIDGTAPVWWELVQDGVFAPLTSITPSTTTAALTSLWTGRSTAAHGVAGYELWLKEYGMITNMITHNPAVYPPGVGNLVAAGFEPEVFLNSPTLGPHLTAQGVKVNALQHHSILHSGLSQMFFKEVEVRGFNTPTDLWVNARHLLENQAGERSYTWIYWGEVDHFSHFYGPADERTAAEFGAFSSAFERLFLHRLSAVARKDTVVLLTADHGQIATPKDLQYDLRRHPELTRRLHMLPTGESRLAYLFIRPGQTEAVREYIERTWPGQFTLLEPAYAVEAGLFGPGQIHPRLLDRLGDLLVVAQGEAYWWWADKENRLLGRHGGLSPHEMLVPFLGARM